MLTDVEELADRVAILVNGKLVTVESVAELRSEFDGDARTLEDIYLRYAESV
jgi:ABC-type multidrug transport system ATPase subunit